MIKRIFGKQREDFFARQADEARAERMAIEERLRMANLRSFSIFDPQIKLQYERLLAENGSPALAEVGAIRHAQQLILQRAFSVFDDWE